MVDLRSRPAFWRIFLLSVFLFLASCDFGISQLSGAEANSDVPPLDITTTTASALPTPSLSPSPAPATATQSPAVVDSFSIELPSLTSNLTATRGTIAPTQVTPIDNTGFISPTVQPILSPTPRMNLVSDLLFLAEERFSRWRFASKQVVVLADDTVAFSSTPDGKKAALLQRENVAANGLQLFNVSIMDLARGETDILLSGIPRLRNLSLSPNGHWLTYSGGDTAAAIYVILVDGSRQPVLLGECQDDFGLFCDENMIWSQDGKMLAWSDTQGIWIYKAGDAAPQLAIPGQMMIKDPRGDTNDVPVYFEGLKWSTDNRYLSAWVRPKGSRVRWMVVVDDRLTRISNVPDTFELLNRSASEVWMEDGRLLLVHRGDVRTGRQPSVRIWKVVPTREDLLGLDASFYLNNTEDLIQTDISQDGSNYLPDYAYQLGDNLIGVAFHMPNSSQPVFMLSIDLEKEYTQIVQELPYDSREFVWSFARNGALVLSEHAQIFFAPVDHSPVLNLQSILSREACCFIWLPPVSSRP